MSGASLSAAALQFIDDMEEQQLVADRRLLARLVIVQEELRWLGQEAGEAADGPLAFGRANVPQRCIAFLKVRPAAGRGAMCCP